MNHIYCFIFAVAVLIGMTNGQASNDWFAQLLNTQKIVPTQNMNQQQQQQQQQQLQQLLLPQKRTMTFQNNKMGMNMSPFKRDDDISSNGNTFSCSDSPCLNGATCVDSFMKGFECKCPWGFSGERCETSATACALNPCPANRVCKARTNGGFDCVCPADRTGPNCDMVSTVCANNPCMNGGTCEEIEGESFVCNCMKPWAGTTCTEVFKNPCTEENLRSAEVQQFKNPWDRHSFLICLDKDVYHSMQCSVGTYFNEHLLHCVPEGYDPPKCPAGYCLNDGECLIDSNNLLKCVCKKGFSGERCNINIDECALEGNAACQGGVCVDQVNGYYCKCPGGMIGVNCQQTIANPCTAANLQNNLQFVEVPTLNNNVYLQCTSEMQFEVRKCADNLFWNQEEETCTAEKPRVKGGGGICVTFPCKNGGECVESGPNGFTCNCKRGFTGITCEEMIDNCQSNPCQNGGTCVSFAGGYTCMCPNKVVDECCCHGVNNPCPPRKKIIPGVNNYFKHSVSNRYIHCDFEGRAFVRSCAPGTMWNQNVLTCTPESFFSRKDDMDMVSAPANSYSMPSKMLPSVDRPMPAKPQLKNFYDFQMPSPTSYGSSAPSNSYQSYNQAPVEIVTTTTTTTTTSPLPIVKSIPNYQNNYQNNYQTYQQPTYAQPVTVTEASPIDLKQPVVSPSSSYEQPGYTNYQQPTYQQPTFQQPTYQQPTYQEPVTEARTLQQPIVFTQTHEQPTYENYQPQQQQQQQLQSEPQTQPMYQSYHQEPLQQPQQVPLTNTGYGSPANTYKLSRRFFHYK